MLSSFVCIRHMQTFYSMSNKKFFLPAILILSFSFGIQAQNVQDVMKIVKPLTGVVTEQEAVDGIKEALIKGTDEGVAIVSKLNGYFSNPEIKIPFPENARTIESKLRSIGLGNQVDDVILAINRGAEDAAASAQPIFVSAITDMNISDALQIVSGSDYAATKYLAKTTTPELKAKFSPVIKASLDKVDATRLWSELITVYNQIPFVTKQNPDLTGYVTDKTISGLFKMIGKEELKIRQNPVDRTTELLKKVFGS